MVTACPASRARGPAPANAATWPGHAAAWLRDGRGGLFVLAVLVGAGSGLGAVAFRYLIALFTWLATGNSEFGQQGHVGSAHLPWLSQLQKPRSSLTLAAGDRISVLTPARTPHAPPGRDSTDWASTDRASTDRASSGG